MSIVANLSAAADIVLGRERGLERLDTSTDGFFASFKGLGLVALIDGLSLILTHATRLKLGVTPLTNAFAFAATMLFIALLAYAASMLALYVLCRTEEMQRRFSVAVIAHNWASPVVSVVFLPPFLLLLMMQNASHPNPPSAMATIILIAMIACLIVVGVRLMRISMNATNGQAFSLFAMTAGVSLIIELWLSHLFGL